LDYICSTARFMGSWVCQRLCYWRIHSSAFGDRRGRTAHSIDSRTKINITNHPTLGADMHMNSTMLIGVVLIVIGMIGFGVSGHHL
jgi:hypothetical protein